jgi:hypothetical protein
VLRQLSIGSRHTPAWANAGPRAAEARRVTIPVMPAGPYAGFSFLTFLTLLSVLGLSCLTLWLLVRRATSHRRWVALSDWARARKFRYRPIRDGEPPEPFSRMPGARPSVRLWLTSETVDLLQAGAPSGDSTWHVLIRQVESNWPPTALRPTANDASMLDLFELASFPSMISSERFVIFGADPAAAKTLSGSSLPALLPPDVGLLLHGRHVVLDFSNRPFDAIEFDRMLVLANHLTAHLPAVKR